MSFYNKNIFEFDAVETLFIQILFFHHSVISIKRRGIVFFFVKNKTNESPKQKLNKRKVFRTTQIAKKNEEEDM